MFLIHIESHRFLIMGVPRYSPAALGLSTISRGQKF
nr:MAG TPA: hypothetical protein [Corticoviridae sp.]